MAIAVDPTIGNDVKTALRNRVVMPTAADHAAAAPYLPTASYSAQPGDYSAAGMVQPNVPTTSVRPSPGDYSAAGMVQPNVPTAAVNAPTSLARNVSVTPYPTSAPTGNILPTQTDTAPGGQMQIDEGPVPMGFLNTDYLRSQIQARQAAAVNTANTQDAGGGSGGGAPQPADNISQSNLAAVNNLGAALAPGVSRYALGGNIAGPNAARIYTTRGRNGEPVFTDDAQYAASQSTGGLRRGEVNSDVYANSQQNDATNPRANFQYATSALGAQGLTPDKLGNLDPQARQQALAYATSAAGAAPGTDAALSDTMDANLLRSRDVGNGGGSGYGGGGFNGGNTGVPLASQIAIARLHEQAKQNAASNDLKAQDIAEQDKARQTAQQSADRQDASAFNTQYAAAKVNDPNGAATMLASRIPTDPDALKASLQTASGKQAALALLQDEAVPGAHDAPSYFSPSQRNAAPQLRFKDLALDPKTGGFNGFTAPQGSDTADSETDPTYPATRGLGRRIGSAFGLAPGSFMQTQNYPATLSHLSPAQLRVLKDSGL